MQATSVHWAADRMASPYCLQFSLPNLTIEFPVQSPFEDQTKPLGIVHRARYLQHVRDLGEH
jgi:hypothetical protein